MGENMKSALVIGGCGNIGRQACTLLIERGYFVVCIDDMSSSTALYPEKWGNQVHDNRYFVYMYMDCAELFEYNVKYFGENPQWEVILYMAASGAGDAPIKDVVSAGKFFEWLPKLNMKPDRIVYFSASSDVDTCTLECGDNEWPKAVGEFMAGFVKKKHGIDVEIFKFSDDPQQTDEFIKNVCSG